MCCPLRDVSRRKSDVPAIVLSFLPDVTGCSVVHSYLGFSGMSASELLSDFVKSGGGGGCGGHTYSVLCTVWATIKPRCSVVYGATRYRMT